MTLETYTVKINKNAKIRCKRKLSKNEINTILTRLSDIDGNIEVPLRLKIAFIEENKNFLAQLMLMRVQYKVVFAAPLLLLLEKPKSKRRKTIRKPSPLTLS